MKDFYLYFYENFEPFDADWAKLADSCSTVRLSRCTKKSLSLTNFAQSWLITIPICSEVLFWIQKVENSIVLSENNEEIENYAEPDIELLNTMKAT